MHWGSRLIQKIPRTTESNWSHELGNLTRRIHLLPSDNKKTSNLLGFSIIRGMSKDYCGTESCLEFFSHYSPLIFIINNKIMIILCALCNDKTKWLFARAIATTHHNSISLKTDDDITCTLKALTMLYNLIWNATPTSRNPDINIKYSSAIKEKLAKKNSQVWHDWLTNANSFEKQIKSSCQNI